MHSTTTTRCSNVLESLIELNAYLDDQSICHRGEIVECIIAGIVLIESIQKSTPPELFSDDEQEYIFSTNDRLHEELVTIMT